MGQRLTITAYYKDEAVASAYYHWSAYTSSAIELLNDIRERLIKITDGSFNIEDALQTHITWEEMTEKEAATQLAVDLFTATGAGFFAGRNDGIISITKPEEWKGAAEYIIDIHLDKGLFDFDVVNWYTTTEADIWLEDEQQLEFFAALNSDTTPKIQLYNASFKNEENWRALKEFAVDSENWHKDPDVTDRLYIQVG